MTPLDSGRRIPVAVLGATGAVGQTFVRLLTRHPWFELAEVAASERSAGRSYGEGTRWIAGEMPADAAAMEIQSCDPAQVTAPVVFSALDASVAGDVEARFARAGRTVLSNARNFRMDADVPLLIPEVNAEHAALLAAQRAARGWDGAIVTNPNCAAVVVAMALAPLHTAFGISQLFVSTLQAVSGAGYPGVPSLDILGNIIPYIASEEEKIESETRKILGTLAGDRVEEAPIGISAHANRVPVEHGHTACMSVALRERIEPEDAIRTLEGWRGEIAELCLPSAPRRPLVVSAAPDRPQPRRDADIDGAMAVVVGRIRRDPVLDLRLVATGHNTVRGAAGASILNAELLVARRVITGP